MASDRTRELAKELAEVLKKHWPGKGYETFRDTVLANFQPLLDAFARETRLDELNTARSCTVSTTISVHQAELWYRGRIAELAAQPTPEVKK